MDKCVLLCVRPALEDFLTTMLFSSVALEDEKFPPCKTDMSCLPPFSLKTAHAP